MGTQKHVIFTDQAPPAIGPYSQAIETDGYLFISGQLGIDPVSGGMPPSAEKQTEQSLKNISAILKKRGLDFDDIVKTTIFMIDLSQFGIVNEIYASFFNKDFPARSTVQVSGLPKSGLVEIEVIARIGA
jgi:2-iminobutanoate/2-iminopropanoate deaminase